MGVLAVNSQSGLVWQQYALEDRFFKRILLAVLMVTLLIGGVVPLIKVPEAERKKVEALPPQLAKIILKKQKREIKKPKPIVKNKVQQQKQQKLQKILSESTAQKKVEKTKPKPVIIPKSTSKAVKKAREKAARSGLLAMQDTLADMRQTFKSTQLTQMSSRPHKNVMAQASKAVALSTKALKQQTIASSGGIATQKMMRYASRESLATKATANISSAALDTQLTHSIAAESGQSTKKRVRHRDEDSIRQVFDQNKGAIFALYNKALRKNPALQGKVTVELVIEPSGMISSCKIINSELDDPKLERKLATRIRMMRFVSLDVSRQTIQYSFEFLPS